MDHPAIALEPSLIGRRVRVVSWADCTELFRHYSQNGLIPAEPIGVINAVGDFGAGHVEARVQISGFARPFVFDGHELELVD
jgi:hypothetical protein